MMLLEYFIRQIGCMLSAHSWKRCDQCGVMKGRSIGA